MGKKFDLQVTIDTKGERRALFSVKDPPTGNMTLSRRGTDVFRPAPGFYPDASALKSLPRMAGQRYSIHPSRESPDANLLKATTTVASGKIFHSYHLTKKVIKIGNRFAFMYVQRCPRMDGPRYNAKETKLAQISLGSFGPQHFTLYLGVAVEPPRAQSS